MVQILRPASDVTLDAGWSLRLAATAWEALSDSSDASYVSGNTEGDVCEVAVDPGAEPAPGGLHRMWARTRRFGASVAPVLIDFSVYDGATLVATRTHTQPPGVGFAWYSWDLTAGEIATIVDYTDLRIRSVDAQTVGAVFHYIAEQYLELDDPAPVGGTLTAGERTAVQAGKRMPRVQAEGVAP